MAPFKIVFLAFFQPLELETYFKQNPQMRIPLMWVHGVCIVLWSIWCFISLYFFYDIFNLAKSIREYVSISFSLLIPTIALLISFACGSLFRRDNVVSFLIGSYWSFIVSLYWLWIFFIADILHDTFNAVLLLPYVKDVGIWASEFELLVIPLLLISIGACIINVLGKTTGIKQAFLFAIVSSIPIGLLIMSDELNISDSEIIDNLSNITEKDRTIITEKKTNKTFLKIGIDMPQLYFKGPLLFFDTNFDIGRYSKIFYLLFDCEDGTDIIANPETFKLEEYILRKDLSNKTVSWQEFNNRVVVANHDLQVQSEWRESPSGFKITSHHPEWNIKIPGYNFYQPHILDDTSLFLRTNSNIQILNIANGVLKMEFSPKEEYFWRKHFILDLGNGELFVEGGNKLYLIDYSNKSERWSIFKKSGDHIKNAILLNNKNIFLQNTFTLQILDPSSGNELWNSFQEAGNAVISSFMLVNGNILLHKQNNIQILDYRDGSETSNIPLNIEDAKKIQRSLLLADGKIFLQMPKNAQIFDYEKLKVVTKLDANWFFDRSQQEFSSPILYENNIYGFLEDGVFFGIHTIDEKGMFKNSFPTIYREMLKKETYRNMLPLIGYYMAFIFISLSCGI